MSQNPTAPTTDLSPSQKHLLKTRKANPTLSLNPVHEEYHYDALTDRLTIHKTQDVEGHLDAVRREKNENPNGMSDGRTWRKIGSIPMSLAHKWLVEDGFDCMDPNNAKEVRRRLNTNDKLRTVDRMV